MNREGGKDELAGKSGIYREQLATVEDLEALKKDLLEELKKLLQELSGQAAKKWLKSSEVRKLLGISTGTLQNLRINGSLRCTKIGGIGYSTVMTISPGCWKVQSKDLCSMDAVNQMIGFLSRITSDRQLKPRYLGLLVVLCRAWPMNGCKSPFSISRSKIMEMGGIRSKPCRT